MKGYKIGGLIIGFLVLFLVSCTEKSKKEAKLLKTISEIREEYAPDKRTALFDVHVFTDTEKYILKGESNLPEAIGKLRATLKAENITYTDAIEILPSKELGKKTWAVVNISVANLRSKPKHSAELATQATLGTPVKVFKKDDDWYYIQTPDKYLSWVDAGGIVLMDKSQAENWKSKDKLIYTATAGYSYQDAEEGQRVSDLVAGDILEMIGETEEFFEVQYPDGRKAFVSKEESEPYQSWLEKLEPTQESLVATSKTLMGVPYLWGGTSTKGMDCSGFTKTIFFLNGMVIPRDASQQVHTGKAVDSVKNFDKLQKGDLLFFGKKATDSSPEKVVHVGMWIGNNEFIHASEMVRISSMDKNADNYDEFNHDRYLRSKRILKENDDALISLVKNPVFKD
ncbi:C40 family peptidase [Zobellia galactanivorans]|uniref:Dipeptidyl peptidase, family C40 n=1 Tax=Zobellia galactanivorans (strain DSM 12802 / CCUG 47099 / CIP 106680 / NCIMB 13871 / Dsij) TaxID=63186 RepID=G0L4J5_ZOBGA|nr:C40 family peptidase [Zobellia galactanivorans]MBU3026730.1 C40 family peptidase [Zobellia galactanivorans]MDO6809122.1 C40 family peptidase [Zobellia galactanivorans]CAZ95746.1 Dipeptidyl peptidase, family C40 [Zobellia galactanivorans]